MKALDKRTASVTGAGSGIGRAIALTLAAAGPRVAVSDIRSEWAHQVGKEIATAGGVAMALKLDVTRKPEAEEAVARSSKNGGALQLRQRTKFSDPEGGMGGTEYDRRPRTIDCRRSSVPERGSGTCHAI